MYKKVMEEEKIGVISHYFGKAQVAVLKLEKDLSLNDLLHIKGDITDFEQPLESMQVHHKQVDTAKKGAPVGIKLIEKAREGDIVFRII